MRWTLTFLCFAVLLTPPALPAEDGPPETGEEQSFQELTIDEFGSLEQAGQVEYLCRAVRNFRRQTRNISATTTLKIRNMEYDPKTRKTGSRVFYSAIPVVTELRRIGDSYRIWQHRDVEGNETPPAYPDVLDAYNFESKERRTLLTEFKTGQPAKREGYVFAGRDGLILFDSKAGSIFFYQYLGDDHYLRNEWWDPGTQLLDHTDEVEDTLIDESLALVKVVFSYDQPGGRMRTVTQSYDLRKGGIPVESTIVEQAGTVVKYVHHVRVSDPVQIGNVWMPTTFRLTAWSNSKPRNQATVHTGTVSNIEVGELKAEDLQLTFPEGTKVSDYIGGSSYHVGENGVKIPIVKSPKPAAP